MRARILRPEEWSRLDNAPLLPYVRPENAAVVVVEDDGQIVAALTVLQVTHFEGLWVSPERRGNPGVMRSLLRLASALVSARSEKWVFGGAADDRTRGFMERLGGKQVPMELYALWMGDKQDA